MNLTKEERNLLTGLKDKATVNKFSLWLPLICSPIIGICLWLATGEAFYLLILLLAYVFASVRILRTKNRRESQFKSIAEKILAHEKQPDTPLKP